MDKCPFHPLRSDLPPLTERIAKLPVDERGYPVPYFVQWIDGKPDFRVIDSRRMSACHKLSLCWICGQQLGKFKTFTIGPMCAINRISSELPSHTECAEWAVKGCPFLARPHAKRREDDFTRENEKNIAGVGLKRNPGVTLLWTTTSYKVIRDPSGKPLISVGEPEKLSWWREGRNATRAEIMESIETGLPLLRDACQGRPDDLRALEAETRRAMKLLPA